MSITIIIVAIYIFTTSLESKVLLDNNYSRHVTYPRLEVQLCIQVEKGQFVSIAIFNFRMEVCNGSHT